MANAKSLRWTKERKSRTAMPIPLRAPAWNALTASMWWVGTPAKKSACSARNIAKRRANAQSATQGSAFLRASAYVNDPMNYFLINSY